MTPKQITLTLAALVVFVIVSASLFTVMEGQHALVTRLGKLTQDKEKQANVFSPGLHFKVPMIDKVIKLDTRLQTLDIDSSRIVTSEKKDVIVDYFVKWRINNLAEFYRRTGGQVYRAEELLKQQVNDGLRAEFGHRTIRDVVSDDRASIMHSLNEKADVGAKQLGIDVVDVRIKRIDLPTEVSSAVYERMRAERERVAREHRAEGKAKSEAIKARADAKATVIVATAQARANEVRAQGDAKAAAIYSNAYSKDESFYSFFRSLQAYLNTFDSEKNLLVVDSDSQFFEFFNKSSENKQ